MATKIASHSTTPSISEITELQHALATTQFSLNYEKSSRIVESVARDEEIRKLKFRIAVLEDEVEELNETLAKEEERADLMLQDLEDAVGRAEEMEGEAGALEGELRVRTRELETARAEVAALSDISNDTTKVLKEKLTLARELANLKPELEHLRSQASSHQDLLSEKLSLQRQLSTVQVELENAKRSAERATTKTGKNDDKIEDYKTQIDELKKELRDAKQSSKKTETLERELASARQEVEALKSVAATSKATATTTTSSATSKTELDALKKELATEKKERIRAEKALEKEQTGHEAQRSTLEDKLASFRAKLRTTKEKLKETEAELESARTDAASNAKTANVRGKKGGAAKEAVVDPDAMLGTPGDHAPAKRGRKGATASHVGDKSTFSITPFLNRTMSLAPESPKSDSDPDSASKKRKAVDEEGEEEDAQAGAEPHAPTPSATATGKKGAKKTAANAKPKALAPASSAKQNSKPPSKRSKTSIPTLEKVAEEDEVESPKKAQPAATTATSAPSEPSTNDKEASTDNASEPAYQEKKTTSTVPLGQTLVPKLKSSAQTKPRKSLLSFAAFTTEETSPKPQKKTKRKLLGSSSSGFGKTLFDEDDGEIVKSKPVPGRGLFAKRSLLGGKGKLGGVGGAAAAGVEESGFVFSPLKKDRRALAAAQSMLGN